MYLYGLLFAVTMIVLTVLAAMGLNRLREGWQARARRHRQP